MEVFKKYWGKLVQHLKLSNKIDFDDDFYEIFQIYHFFNLYHPHQTLKKQIVGIVTFALIAFSYLGGILMAIYDTIEENEIHRAMLLSSMAALLSAFTTQNLNMSISQTRIIKLVKTLQSLHEKEDEAEIQIAWNSSVKMLKWYKMALSSISLLFVCKLLGFNLCNLFIPTVYDKWATSGCFYGILLFVNFVHTYLASTLFYASESFHFLCFTRIEANLKLLCKKVRNCTNGSKEDNEKELISLVKYRLAIFQ